MQIDPLFYNGYMNIIQDKITNRTKSANTITELLAIDRGAVYRHLRGKYEPFFLNTQRKIIDTL